MRVLLMFLTIFTLLSATEYRVKYWQKGLSFGEYLNRFGIDATKLYKNIAPEDLEHLASIMEGSIYFEDANNNKLNKTLIPLGEEMQIYLYKDKKGEYKFDIVPINYKIVKDKVFISINNNCYLDLKNATNNSKLAFYLKKIFKDYIDFKKLQKGDKVVVFYEQKSLEGIAWGEPKIEAAYIQTKDNEFFAILNEQKYNIYSNKLIKEIKKVTTNAKYLTFTQPLQNLRITSKFTYKRWHPILHRYRPHLGIDFGAKRGTSIYAIAKGKVIYAGWIRGYGKVVKIDHGNGIISLYAHQSKILVRNNQLVQKGEVIGEVGSTGRSTGPHLHLGVYRYGKAVNPNIYINKHIKIKNAIFYNKVVKIVKNIDKNLPEKEKKVYNLLKNFSFNLTPYLWKSCNKKLKINIKVDNAKRSKLSNSKGDSKITLK